MVSGLLKCPEEDLSLKRVGLEDRSRYLDAKHNAGSANAAPFYHPYRYITSDHQDMNIITWKTIMKKSCGR